MKNKICVMTATRAEYGLLRNVIKKLSRENDVRVAVTGMHLSKDFGNTIEEIEKDNIKIDVSIDILSDKDTSVGISESMATAIVKFAEYFHLEKPDILIVLGDRYETLSVCIAAMNERIPIIHIHGGETTQGAIDEYIRHAISKMSILHFVSCEDYRRRVIQLGENPQTVYNVGGLGVENIKTESLLTREELSISLGFSLESPFAIVTYHPVTLENRTAGEQISQLLKAIEEDTNRNYIITKSNADEGGREINRIIENEVNGKKGILLVNSLGMQRYLSALKYAEMVIGNSSSGIMEVPSFKIPTINIGDRQKGRIQAESVINCEPLKEEIKKAMRLASSKEFKQRLVNVISPYEREGTCDRICDEINKYFESQHSLKKVFYDLPKEVIQ